MLDMDHARDLMIERQLVRRGVSDPYVLQAMRTVPREVFVPRDLQNFAYEDGPLPIAAGQTISQPFIVGYMIEAAGVRPGDRVLEIGAGSGYAAAVMSRIAARVFTIERHAELSIAAAEQLERLGYDNVEVRTGDGTRGWPEAAPFDAVLVAAGGREAPEALRKQLAVGGRLIIPLGEHGNQRLVRLTRSGEDDFEREDLGGVMFVPLIAGSAGDEAPPTGIRPGEATDG